MRPDGSNDRVMIGIFLSDGFIINDFHLFIDKNVIDAENRQYLAVGLTEAGTCSSKRIRMGSGQLPVCIRSGCIIKIGT